MDGYIRKFQTDALPKRLVQTGEMTRGALSVNSRRPSYFEVPDEPE